jgi:hypothetical protein
VRRWGIWWRRCCGAEGATGESKASESQAGVEAHLAEALRGEGSRAEGRAAIATVSADWVLLRLTVMKAVCGRLT